MSLAPDDLVIPASIYRRDGLSLPAKLVYGYLAMRQGRSSKAWPSVAAIAEDLGVNRKTAMRAAGDLEQLGLVVVERRYGAVNRYRIAPDGHENPSPKGTGCQTRPVPQRDRTSPPKGHGTLTRTLTRTLKTNMAIRRRPSRRPL